MTGRERRLLHEWQTIEKMFPPDGNVRCTPSAYGPSGLPVAYEVEYRVRSISGVDAEGKPVFGNRFVMDVRIPSEFPDVDAPVELRFRNPVPWHPNIRYFGPLAGRVCLNQIDTFGDIAWAIARVGQYLTYERYHAINEPPYPEDQQVAAWVVRQGEPNEWIYFDQDE